MRSGEYLEQRPTRLALRHGQHGSAQSFLRDGDCRDSLRLLAREAPIAKRLNGDLSECHRILGKLHELAVRTPYFSVNSLPVPIDRRAHSASPLGGTATANGPRTSRSFKSCQSYPHPRHVT